MKKVWNDVNKLYDKIPNSVKFTIGAIGVAVAVVTGAAPLGAAIGTLALAMYSGAVINAGIYAAGAFFKYHDFSLKEMGKAAIDGAADGALFAGIGLTAKGITYAVKNPEPLKAFLADETGGEINLSKFGKSGSKTAKTIPQQLTQEGKTPAIGKMKDLNTDGNVLDGEFKIADYLPDKGNPKANWKQNSGILRSVMNENVPIKDVSPFPMENAGFLGAERNLLQSRGWVYSDGYWCPPSN